jgi:hypothetical protein
MLQNEVRGIPETWAITERNNDSVGSPEEVRNLRLAMTGREEEIGRPEE